jgi:hypothetical protein
MREEKTTADRLAAYSDAVSAVIVTNHGPGVQGTRSLGVLGAPASVADCHQRCGELRVHCHYLDKPPLPYAVRRSPTLRLIWINFIYLFMVSLLPLRLHGSRARLASFPVAFCAGRFVYINMHTTHSSAKS